MPPVLVSKVAPSYSPDASSGAIEGSVVLGFEVSVAGVAQDIRIIRSLDPGLDQSAIRALQKWRFRPATRNGKAIAFQTKAEIAFHLLPQRK
ncbi:energy transducer TonB [Bryobacter aggregatus]|uniref:energy transducer TonB n=1 Tax=Bryobacter aggregatus TaxID=360054 RepID=UPI00138DF6B4